MTSRWSRTNQGSMPLLAKREQRSLRICVSTRLVFVVVLMLGELTSSQSRAEQLISFGLVFAFTVLSLTFLCLLRNTGRLRIVGLSGAILDVVALFALVVIWELSFADRPASAVYVSKTVISIVAIVVIAYNGAAFRALYPLIVTVGATLLHAFLLVQVLIEEETVLTTDLFDYRMGSGFSVGMFVWQIVLVACIGAIVTMVSNSARKTVEDVAEFERATMNLNRFFSPKVAEKIRSGAEGITQPGGRTQEIAVLFSDIEGFTELSARIGANSIVQLLSRYHGEMVNVIHSYDGTLDKFIGDGIMATFGTPAPGSDDSARAVAAAIAMNAALTKVNELFAQEGLPEIRHRIGIHCGQAIVGNIGTENRMEFTAIGDVVNIASRIESVCKDLNLSLLFSESVLDGLDDDAEAEFVGSRILRGLDEPVNLYTVRR